MELDNHSNIPLGKNTHYKDQYDPSLLFPISRALGRSKIGLEVLPNEKLPFKGYDVWNCYEVSWLSASGKPEVRVMEMIVPYDSENIVESKSLKLYLYALNNTRFASESEVYKLIKQDITAAIKSPIFLKFYKLSELPAKKLINFNSTCLDTIDLNIDKYEVNPEILQLDVGKETVVEVVHSDLLRSNCLVTNQPDWGSVQISYTGSKINHKSLLEYIVSFRNHIEFHEQCVERIFMDIMRRCNPTILTVQAKYTRRGGIDINPIRSNVVFDITDIDNSRLTRQ